MSPQTLATIFLVAGFLAAALLTAALIPVLRRIAVDRGWVDHPDGDRKMHIRPVPSIGGVAIACGFLAGLLLLVTFDELFPAFSMSLDTSFFIGAVLTAAVGFYDDVRGVSFKTKFAAQVVIALFLIQAGYRIDLGWLIQSDPYNEMLYSAALTLLWVVGIMNAVNLIDGLDGLAGGVVLIAFLSLGAIFGLQGELGLVAIAVVMIGALSAFLAFNFSPASIFMGDTGSLFLGYVVAAFSLYQPAHVDPMIALLVPVMVLGLPVLDTTLSVVRRFSRGNAIFAPDKDHLHHRLCRLWAPERAVVTLYGAATFFGMMAVLMAISTPTVALVFVGIAGVTTFSVVRQLGYEPAVIAEDIKRRFVEPQVQAMSVQRADRPASDHLSVSARRASGDGAFADRAPSTNGASGDQDSSSKKAAAESDLASGDGASGSRMPVFDVEKMDEDRGLKLDTVIELENDITSANLDGESVLLCLRTGSYFGLNETGSSILHLLKDQPRSVVSIVDDLQERYDADRNLIQSDVVGFLDEMRRRRLVRADPKTRA